MLGLQQGRWQRVGICWVRISRILGGTGTGLTFETPRTLRWHGEVMGAACVQDVVEGRAGSGFIHSFIALATDYLINVALFQCTQSDEGSFNSSPSPSPWLSKSRSLTLLSFYSIIL